MNDFLKQLALVVVVPLIVSSLAFASKYGSSESAMDSMIQSQQTILDEIKLTKMDLITIRTGQENDRLVLNSMSDKLERHGNLLQALDREIGAMQSNIGNLKSESIPGGNERIRRLEDKVLGK